MAMRTNLPRQIPTLAIGLFFAPSERTIASWSLCALVNLSCFPTSLFPTAPSAAARQMRTSTPLQSVANPADTHGLSHWKVERLLSVALVPLIPAAFIAPGPAVDYGLAVIVPIHNYLGMDAIITDYVAHSLKGAVKGLNFVGHVATIGGLIYFNMNDVGICEGIKMLWSL
ncbi:uncharacterized protein MONBRDRAFT_32293 [Monosiga brevicollis MX1]|uniref:Succinate dehydrogenase [ubiquinone] cytochrome b small subunit n=1 Tax=Monosiga brevicollis TaxID=81824 RepID=A9UYL4_MONBE|nr:uncharacterized protein MONBRDRAFT_32293 [Monosiga brevicollis MX1]EDQ89625.1 predicted protein [Monosiga brevicollis MX1]|eukprot:XP_001745654.1 hypothetical protein [Monosiga brevicollis MX1]